MHEIGKNKFIFGFKGYDGPSLFDSTYFNTVAYQYKEYSDKQGQYKSRSNITELPLTYWGDQVRFLMPSPAFENSGISEYYCPNSTDYTVGGNPFSIDI